MADSQLRPGYLRSLPYLDECQVGVIEGACCPLVAIALGQILPQTPKEMRDRLSLGTVMARETQS